MAERRQERKVVTVLFSDLVGFTQQAEQMDPEDVAALLEPYHARLKAELERYGGTVEKFIGDAVMALFGVPVTHEDDPERAVRAALAIRDFAADEGIELRIGITTGEALVTLGARPEHGETMAAGDVVNTAARLQAAARVSGILVSRTTRAATKDAIEYEEQPPVEGKGKARPIPVWEALRARSRIVLERPHATPLAGRTRELGLLTGALARARAEREPQLVTLVGVPGIGKSRLVYELSQAADPERELIAWRQGRCLPYGEGVTFWALSEIVKAQLGIRDTDAMEQVERKVGEAAPEEWIRTQLRLLVGLGVGGIGETDRREEAFVAWRSFLEKIAAERPLVLVFEDIHWADGNLLDFIDHVIDWATGVALLVVCTARPELLVRRADWGGGKANSTTISLAPLSDEDTARLVSGLIQRAVMPAETQEALLARAGGNPLYAEQYARLLAERTEEELPIPETVHAIIAARLDELSPEQKALLQDAAVLGKTFWLTAVASISSTVGADAVKALHALERRGFVRRERQSSIEDDTEYAFLHVLMRDVAYGQIPRAARAEKHRLAAEWIESLGRPEDNAELLAYHYGEALELARAAHVDISALEEPARRALRNAGDRAWGLYAYAAALRYYEGALADWPEDDPDRPQLLYRRALAHYLVVDDRRIDLLEEARDALLAAGDRETAAEAEIFCAWATRLGGRPDEAVKRTLAAAGLLESAPPSHAKAFVVAHRARFLLFVVNRLDEGIEAARQALAMAEELGLYELQANALAAVGFGRVAQDDFDGLEDLEASLRLMREHGSPFELSRVYNNLLIASVAAGRVERGNEILAAYRDLVEQHGVSSFLPALSVFDAYHGGRWEKAGQCLESLRFDEPGQEMPGVRCIRARMRLARDDLEGARADCARASELQAQWEPGELADVLTVSAKVALADGRRAEAVELAERVFSEDWPPPGLSFTDTSELALVLLELGLPAAAIVEVAEARPRSPWLQVSGAVARGELAAAADRLAALEAFSVEAEVRLRAAERLVAKGRRAEADVQLQKALAFYRSVGATRYIREGEALLAATA